MRGLECREFRQVLHAQAPWQGHLLLPDADSAPLQCRRASAEVGTSHCRLHGGARETERRCESCDARARDGAAARYRACCRTCLSDSSDLPERQARTSDGLEHRTATRSCTRERGQDTVEEGKKPGRDGGRNGRTRTESTAPRRQTPDATHVRRRQRRPTRSTRFVTLVEPQRCAPARAADDGNRQGNWPHTHTHTHARRVPQPRDARWESVVQSLALNHALLQGSAETLTQAESDVISSLSVMDCGLATASLRISCSLSSECGVARPRAAKRPQDPPRESPRA